MTTKYTTAKRQADNERVKRDYGINSNKTLTVETPPAKIQTFATVIDFVSWRKKQ